MLLLLGVLTMLGPLSMDLYLPGLSALAGDLHASASTAQLTITACLVGLAGGQLLAGPLTDALGRRRPLVIGVATFAATSLLCAFAPTIELLLAVRVAQGAAGSVAIVVALAVVRDLVGGDAAARAYAQLVMVSGLAPLLAPVVGGQLLAVTDWRGTFFVLSALGGLMTVAAWRWLPETLDPTLRHTGGAGASLRAMARLLADRDFLALATCIGLSFGMLMVYLAGSVFLLEDVHGVSPQAFGLIFTINSGLMIASSQVSARIVRRVGAARLLRIGLGLGIAGALGLLVAVAGGLGLVAVLPALAVVLASRGLIYPNAQALAVADHPDAAGTAAGVTGLARFGFGAAFAPLAGIGGAGDAMPMAIVVMATAVAAAAVLALRTGAAAARPA